MNILFISHTHQRGGASNMLSSLVCGVKIHHSTHVIYRFDNIEKYVKENKVDVIISNTITTKEGIVIAKKYNIPHIWYIHEMHYEKKYYENLADSDFVVAISNAVKKELLQYVPKDKIRVIHNGIEVNREPKKRQRNFKIISAAGVCRRKDQMTLLLAAKRVIDVYKNAKFEIVGGVWERDYYKELSRTRAKLGLTKENFVMHQVCRNMDSFYNSGELFVLSSNCEPFGLVLLEAMRAGLPVISTDSGGPSEFIDETTGFLTPVGNDKVLAEKILYVLDNPKLCDKIGYAGYERVKNNFNYEKYINEFMEVIESFV